MFDSHEKKEIKIIDKDSKERGSRKERMKVKELEI